MTVLCAVFFVCFSMLVPNCGSQGVSYNFSSFPFNETVLEDLGCNSIRTCIRKCCDVNYIPIHKTCVFNGNKTFSLSVYHEETFLKEELIERNLVVPGIVNCAKDKYYRLDSNMYEDDVSYIQKNGKLWLPKTRNLLNLDEFCVDYFEDIGISFLKCYDQPLYGLKLGRRLNRTGKSHNSSLAEIKIETSIICKVGFSFFI